MEKYIHIIYFRIFKRYFFLPFIFLTLLGLKDVNAQANESFNDAGIRLRVWLHAVYSDANCSENIINGPTKFVYNKLRVRASNGTGYIMDNFPAQNILTNFYAQDMRFRVKGRTNRFWKVNDSQFRMLNPFYPFGQSTFPGLPFPGATYMSKSTHEAAPLAPSGVNRPVGTQLPDSLGFLLFDRTFSGGNAPDRYQWRIEEMFESDADISGNESVMNIAGVGCKTTFGLPQYYEGKKGLLIPPYDPLMNLLILDSTNLLDFVVWASAVGNCTNLFGWELDPMDLVNLLAGLIGISDMDDSYARKSDWAVDPAFFRGTSANQRGFYTTSKVMVTENRDGTDEGYILVFAHQWEWTGADSGYPEPTGVSRIQAPLCSTEQYTDASSGSPINLQVWLDGYFTDADHEGTGIPIIGEALECADMGIGPSQITGSEEKYIRARARAFNDGMGGWNATIKTTQDRPNWISANQQILNRNFTTETGMNTFSYDLESWESDCLTDAPSNSCTICILGGSPGNDCCITEVSIPLIGDVCVWPTWPLNELSKYTAGDNDNRAAASGTVNWRNSPPSVDNYVYVPIQLSTSRYQSHLARLRYRWTIANPVAGTVSGPRDVVICPGQTHTMSVTNSTNATWYQWQYAVVTGPAGPACPGAEATWIDVPAAQGGICPQNFNTGTFTGTRVYRLKVFNRNGPGSKSSSGEKFAIAYSVCTRISILDSLIVPIDAPIACGTAGSPTIVRAGSAINLRPVLPPNPGSTSIPGIRYVWASSGGTVSPTSPMSSPWETTLTFPSTSPTNVSVTMTTWVTDVCPTATNYSTTCYFRTEDPGCSGVTGVIYVSHAAAAGGIGTINRPYTLSEGFAAVAGDPNITHVKILAGNYTISGSTAMLLRNNLVVEGNYIQEFDTELGENIWVKRSDAVTNITSNIIESPGLAIHRIGFRSTGNNWVLQDINITTANAPDRDAIAGTHGTGVGPSNYAIHINGATGWKLINVNATAGQAGKGSQGSASIVETCPDASFNYGNYCNNNPAGQGDRSGGNAGGINTPGGTATKNGSSAIPPNGGGFGGAVNTNGNTGVTGTAGTAAGGRVLANLDAWTYFTPTGSLSSGRGQSGGGGGGGGGNASSVGGAGGIGGMGGNAGYGSGTAFGIWVSGGAVGTRRNSTTLVTSLTPVAGGDGGPGALGYAGQVTPAGDGGQGGTGGQGGLGAPGGVDGFNMNEYIQTATGSSLTVDVGGAYPPTRVESDYSSGCTNSKVVIRKGAAGLWADLTLSGAVNYQDIYPLGTSTPSNSDSPKLIYYPTGSLGAKNLELSPGGTYVNQIYVRYERPVPTITVPSVICSGTPINLSSTSGMANPIEHEWVIQRNVPTPTGVYTGPTPAVPIMTVANPTGVLLPANNTALPITYQVRYRVRDNCCGWSIPIYDTVTVNPELVNIINTSPESSDITYICNVGRPDTIITRIGYPVPTHVAGGSWNFQWYRSVDGGAFSAIGGATNESYIPPVMSTPGEYRFMRIITSTSLVCGDTSNIRTIIVTENFDGNIIDNPVPPVATCVGTTAFPARGSGTVNTSNVNIGSMTGSAPVGPGDPSTYYYEWQMYRNGAWINIPAGFPTTSGATFGYGSAAQHWDPGTGVATNSYGNSTNIFNQTSGNTDMGIVQFRRIVSMAPGDLLCRDTSNVVASQIPFAEVQWGHCYLGSVPPAPFNNSRPNCLTTDPLTTMYQFNNSPWGYFGNCVILGADTVCPGATITLDVPSNTVGGVKGVGQNFAWYKVTGGPYNRDHSGTALTNPCTAVDCSNPMMNYLCARSKPEKSDFVTFTPYYPNGYVSEWSIDPLTGDTIRRYSASQITVQIDTTTTYYANIVGRCFDDATFRAMPTATAANRTAIETYSGRWQRRTIITVTPFVQPSALNSSDTLWCRGSGPANITLTIVGGDLGNDGEFVIYDEHPDSNTLAVPLFRGGKRNATATGRTVTIPAPTVNTTYYARVENRCYNSVVAIRPVTIVDPPVAPDSLTGPDFVCAGEQVTLTVHGGSLGDTARWVLYNGDPLGSGTVIASNTTGIFTHTPTANTIYYVRAEAPVPCTFTAAVSKEVTYVDTCICDNNPGYVEYAPDGVTTLATVECEDSDGWTWYATAANPTEYLFAIQKRPSTGVIPNANTLNFTAEVRITVTPNPTTMPDVFYGQDIAACEANFVMPRYWNVTVLSGGINGYIKTRFFYKPAELQATRNRAQLWITDNQPGCDPLLAGVSQVFKNTDGSHFISGPVTGLYTPVVSATTDIQPTTINNFVYVGHSLLDLPYGSVSTIDGKNYVEVAWDGFSGGGIAIRVSPDLTVLPVTIVSFTGTLVHDKVLLNWETASELNNDYFIVEKSTDAINWNPIGNIKGNGTTSLPHYYSLIDNEPNVGVNYYRLKQVDFDGTHNYSKVIQILYGMSEGGTGFLEVHPNPTDGPVIAKINSLVDQHVNVRILDIAGRVMGNKEVSLGKGLNQVKLDLGSYPAATYIISFTDDKGEEYNVRVVKQ